jgi:hypothetical protein
MALGKLGEMYLKYDDAAIGQMLIAKLLIEVCDEPDT